MVGIGKNIQIEDAIIIMTIGKPKEEGATMNFRVKKILKTQKLLLVRI
jgi:hypothetical protein